MTATVFGACLTACINPKHITLEGTGTLIGRVIDATSNEPIAGAMLRDEVDRQAVADPEGAFALPEPSGDHVFLVSADGYKTQKLSVKIQPQATARITTDGYVRLQRTLMP